MTKTPRGAAGLHEISQRLSELMQSVEQKFQDAGKSAQASSERPAGPEAETGRGGTRVFESPDGRIRAEMGLRMRIGGLPVNPRRAGAGSGSGEDAASRAERRPAPRASDAPDAEPDVPNETSDPSPAFEIFEETDHLLITLERPAFEGQPVAMRLEEVVLVARFDGETLGEDLIEERIPLPAGVPAHSTISHAWRNGILCIRIETSGQES